MARPITVTTPEAITRRQWYSQRRHPIPGPCPDCGRVKSLRAVRCRSCAQEWRRKNAKTAPRARYARKYMEAYRGDRAWQLRRRRVETRLCQSRECLLHGYDHHHCECGLALAPTEHACPMCIAEQRRIEFKTWPKEAA